MDIYNLEQRLKEIKTLKTRDKKSTVSEFMKDLQKAEMECASDYSIPFDQVKRVRAIIDSVQRIKS